MKRKIFFIVSMLFTQVAFSQTIPGAISETGWWDSISPFGQVIIYIIAGLFFLSLVMIGIEMVRYKFEKKALDRVIRNYSGLRAAIDNIPKNELSSHLTAGCKSKRLISRQVENLGEIASQHQKINYNDLAENQYLSESSRFSHNFIKYVRPNLVVLGLLGTFWGLILMVGHIDAIFTSIDSSSLQALIDSFKKATKDMARIITPMQTAFSTSLTGLAATILLSFFMLFSNWVQKRFFSRLDNFTVTKLVPVFSPKEETGLVEDLKALLSKMSDITTQLGQLSKDVVTDMANINQITQVFENSAKGIIQSQQDLMAGVEDLNKLIAEVRENTDMARTGNERILSALENYIDNMRQANRKFEELELKTDSWLSDIIELIQEQQKDFKKTIKQISDENKEDLKAAFNEFKTTGQHFEASVNRMSDDVINSFRQISTENKENLKTTLEEIRAGNQSLEKYLYVIADNFSGSSNAIVESIEKLIAKHEDLLSKITEILSKVNSTDYGYKSNIYEDDINFERPGNFTGSKKDNFTIDDTPAIDRPVRVKTKTPERIEKIRVEVPKKKTEPRRERPKIRTTTPSSATTTNPNTTTSNPSRNSVRRGESEKRSLREKIKGVTKKFIDIFKSK